MQLDGAAALVTGASRGIGRAIAMALAGEGVKVSAFARSPEDLKAVVAEIRSAGGTAVAVPGDVRSREACDEAVRRVVAAHGGLQILINNAGVGARGAVADTDDETWARVMETNVTGVFRLTRAALPHLTKEGGHIFMVSSLAGQNAIAGMAAYCASKAALDHFTACLMLEVREQGVKVTTLAPGSVDTDFGGLGGGKPRPWALQPADIAATVVSLLKTRDEAHLSRVEMRPSRPPSRA